MTDFFSIMEDEPPRPPIDYQAELNQAQYEAVTTTDGPIVVVAGAGSGKTRTLVYRVAYLVDQGVEPESILLLTFTRKAAQEMLKRAEALVGEGCRRVSGGTFHALANELLRFWADRIGFPPNFGLMDRSDMEEVLGRLRKQASIAEKEKGFPKRATVATMISKAANKSLPLNELLIDEYVHLSPFQEPILALATEYFRFKKENALLDFDDLLIYLARLLAEDEETRARIARRYRYIMVDEYQDTNRLQADIVHHLGRDHHNIMVVGDDAQSIYSFRGASFKNIMEFPVRYPEARIIRLEENYRSCQPILNLTNFIIGQATEKYEKKLFTRREGGDKPRILKASNQMDQTLFVVGKIKELQARGLAWSDMAVLFRASRHSFKLEIELNRAGIGYVKVGGRRFLEAAHIKDLLSFLRVVANPKDTVSLTRLLMLLEGIGPKSAGKIAAWVEGRRENLLRLSEAPAKGKTKAALAPMAELMERIARKGVGLEERVNGAWEFYQPIMMTRFDNYPSRKADVDEFLPLALNYSSLQKFLADMALDPPNTAGLRPGDFSLSDKLVLSTVHSAKGLEWKAVFIIWATEGRFPPFFALEDDDALDEERRLMYVAATRAEDHLFIICPMSLEFEGSMPQRAEPSRFIADVPPELAAFTDKQPRTEAGPRPAGRPDVPKTPMSENISEGQKVTHPVFGLGRVMRLLPGRKAKVDFDHFGIKTLHLDFAGLKKAGN